MRNKLNEIIDSYRRNSELYSVLRINYADHEITEAEYNESLEAIKRTVVNYYLYKYSFSTVENKEIQNDLLTAMIRYCNLHRCTKIVDGKLKIYPINTIEKIQPQDVKQKEIRKLYVLNEENELILLDNKKIKSKVLFNIKYMFKPALTVQEKLGGGVK